MKTFIYFSKSCTKQK